MKTKSIKTLNAYTWIMVQTEPFSAGQFISATALSKQGAYNLLNDLETKGHLAVRGLIKHYKVSPLGESAIPDYIKEVTHHRLEVKV